MALGGFRGILELLGVWLRQGPRGAAPPEQPTTATIRMDVSTEPIRFEVYTGPARMDVSTEPIRTKVSTEGTS